MPLDALPKRLQRTLDALRIAPILLPPAEITDAGMKWRRERFGDHEIGVAPLVTDDEGILLVRETVGGAWTIPGGYAEWGEEVEDACIREAKEETGLDLEVIRPLALYRGEVFSPHQGRLDSFLVLEETKVISGVLGPLDPEEVSEARFFTSDELHKLIVSGPFHVTYPELDGTLGPEILNLLRERGRSPSRS